MEDNLKGLLQTYKEFTFLKQSELLRFYIDTFYPNETIAIVYQVTTGFSHNKCTC